MPCILHARLSPSASFSPHAAPGTRTLHDHERLGTVRTLPSLCVCTCMRFIHNVGIEYQSRTPSRQTTRTDRTRALYAPRCTLRCPLKPLRSCTVTTNQRVTCKTVRLRFAGFGLHSGFTLTRYSTVRDCASLATQRRSTSRTMPTCRLVHPAAPRCTMLQRTMLQRTK